MLEGLTYSVTVALFSFVIVASARMSHDVLILACIPPVFVAIIVGFIMGIYTWDNFGLAPVLAALGVSAPLGWRLGTRYSSRDLLLCIYLAWALGMVCALVAFGFPDADPT
jgi:hypothetical protein